ncbi:hypothetical protein [Roseomonas elaeocarpi]|uniref:Phage tail protein n=1 Tax=Roseomonas elaeocarpi TaxID=907779 RepID=A0ABV6JZ01_9PROT
MKLSAVTIVAPTDPQGDWIAPGGEFDDLEVLTVGITDAFTDAQAARHQKLARSWGGDATRAPVRLLRKANMDCLLAHSVFGLRNLKDDDGNDVPWEQVKKMVYEEQYRPLANAMFAAANLATARRAADIEDAEGNSAPSSSSSSNGAAGPT